MLRILQRNRMICIAIKKHLEKRKKQPHDLTEPYSQKALRIAGEMHEVKKDNQRIFAGLSKLISNESFKDYMNAAELFHLIIQLMKNMPYH